MNKGISSVSYKNTAAGSENSESSCYSYHHIVLVSKCRYKIFKNPKTRDACGEAFREIEQRFGFQIKVGAFSDEGNHWHGEVNIPSKFSLLQTIQIFKSHSAKIVFEKIPNLKKRYPRGSLWSGWKHYGSVGPVNEEVVQKYIINQDIEQKKLADFFN